MRRYSRRTEFGCSRRGIGVADKERGAGQGNGCAMGGRGRSGCSGYGRRSDDLHERSQPERRPVWDTQPLVHDRGDPDVGEQQQAGRTGSPL